MLNLTVLFIMRSNLGTLESHGAWEILLDTTALHPQWSAWHKVTLHTMIIFFPFPSRKSWKMRRDGWRNIALLWTGPGLPAAWKNQCQSQDGKDEWMSTCAWACPSLISVVVVVSLSAPPLPVTQLHPNLLFAVIWSGAAWGKTLFC